MEDKKALETLNPKSVFLPILIAVLLISIMVWRDDQITVESFQSILKISVGALFLSILIQLLKDFFNMRRFQLISHGEINLKSAAYIIFLWEFTIAVAPPLIGATTILIFILFREGVPFGKAVAYAILAASMDNLFFITAAPLGIWLSKGEILPDTLLIPGEIDSNVGNLFWLSYSLLLGYTGFMLSAIVLMPKFINRISMQLFNISLLRRFKKAAMEQSHQLLLASKILRGQKWQFWLKLMMMTYAVWILKYAILSAIGGGFVAFNGQNWLMVIGKHLTMWITLLVSPAPGNAGTAEFVFPAFFGDQFGELTFAVSMVWRFVTYYPYLLIGAVLLPFWLRRANS
jgi:hypothetical protein